MRADVEERIGSILIGVARTRGEDEAGVAAVVGRRLLRKSSKISGRYGIRTCDLWYAGKTSVP